MTIGRFIDYIFRASQAIGAAAAPLEALPLPADGARLERELGALARLFDFDPAARQPLGQRLAALRPDAAAALARHGFLSAGIS